MHTIRRSGNSWEVIFVGQRGADAIFVGLPGWRAAQIASYLNGGKKPEMDGGTEAELWTEAK